MKSLQKVDREKKKGKLKNTKQVHFHFMYVDNMAIIPHLVHMKNYWKKSKPPLWCIVGFIRVV